MRPLHLSLAILLILVWGFNFVAIQVGLQDFPPVFLCALRFFLASIPAIFVVKFPGTSFKWVALYGLIMFALQFTLFFMGMYDGVFGGLASIIVQTQVFFTVLLAIVFLDEKLKIWQVIGAIISFSGIALIGMNTKGSVTFMGFLLLIASAAAFGLGNLVTKKIGRVKMLSLVVWGSLIAWPPLLALSLIVDGPDRILLSLHNLSWATGGSVLYIVYLSTLFGYGIWGWLIHRYPLPMMAPFIHLVPIVAIASSVLVLGEALPLWKIVAGILVIAGLCVNFLGPRFFKRRLL
jgi:O-acetylserine/cysteine efflux transporter